MKMEIMMPFGIIITFVICPYVCHASEESFNEEQGIITDHQYRQILQVIDEQQEKIQNLEKQMERLVEENQQQQYQINQCQEKLTSVEYHSGLTRKETALQLEEQANK